MNWNDNNTVPWGSGGGGNSPWGSGPSNRDFENSNTNGNIPIRYSEPNVYQGIMQITPSQFAGKSNRKYIGNERNSWNKEVDDTIAS